MGRCLKVLWRELSVTAGATTKDRRHADDSGSTRMFTIEMSRGKVGVEWMGRAGGNLALLLFSRCLKKHALKRNTANKTTPKEYTKNMLRNCAEI